MSETPGDLETMSHKAELSNDCGLVSPGKPGSTRSVNLVKSAACFSSKTHALRACVFGPAELKCCGQDKSHYGAASGTSTGKYY